MFAMLVFGGEYQVISPRSSTFMLYAIGVGMGRNSVPPTFAQWGSGRNILSFSGAVPIQHMLGGNYVPTDLQELLSWGKAHVDGRATQYNIFLLPIKNCLSLLFLCSISHCAKKCHSGQRKWKSNPSWKMLLPVKCHSVEAYSFFQTKCR